MYFENYRLWISWLVHSLKSTGSEHGLTFNIWMRPKYLQNFHESAFIMFFIILREVDLENVSHNVRWNLRSVCEHNDFQYQVSCSRLWEFVTRISNAVICITNTFSQFFVPFLNSTSNLEHFEKKEVVIANLFPKLQSVKIFVRKRSKEHRLRTGFGSQHVKASQMLVKSRWERFYHVFSSFSTNLIWKISPLVLGEILGVFFNTLTVDDKYPVQGCENLQLPIQMQLPEKRKGFS